MKIKTNINLLSLLLVILIVCLVFSSCGNNNNENESSSTSFATTSSYIEESTTFSQQESTNETTEIESISTTAIETTVGTTTEETTTETTTEETTTETTTEEITTETIVTETTTEETTSVLERVDFIDEKTESYGEYLKLTYNPRYCDIDCEIQKGLGKREIYTLTITMKDGYVFDGWTTNNKMSNNKSTRKPPVSIDKTYAFTAQSEINVYANYSMTVGYHGNGGTIDGYDYITELFSVSSLFCLNTKPNEKNIIRDGYTLIGYNTKQDGSGDFISVGSKYYANASEIDLYCVWIENDKVSDFEYKEDGNNITITKYLGNNSIVSIPEKINGKNVTKIDDRAFAKKTTIEKIVLPLYIESVGSKAFYGCENMTTIVCYDGILSFPDDSIQNCSSFKTLKINASMQGYYWWGTVMNIKFDRLLALKDYKKLVVFGGSGTYLGWDSNQLEEAFGDEYEIVNFGMNASMTNLFQMEMFKYYLNDGDVLLWSPEAGSQALGNPKLSSSSTDSTHDREISMFSWNYDNIALIDVSKYSNILSHFAIYNNLHVKALVPFEFSNGSVNAYGDLITERETKNQVYTYSYATVLKNEANYKEMANQIKILKDKGVKVYYTFACAQKGCATKDVLDKYIKDIERIFGIESISNYEDLLLDIDMFYDSAWHMILKGADIRTKVVIEDLKEYI